MTNRARLLLAVSLALLPSVAFGETRDDHCVAMRRITLSKGVVPAHIDRSTVRLAEVAANGDVRLVRLRNGGVIMLRHADHDALHTNQEFRFVSSDVAKQEAVIEKRVVGPCDSPAK